VTPQLRIVLKGHQLDDLSKRAVEVWKKGCRYEHAPATLRIPRDGLITPVLKEVSWEREGGRRFDLVGDRAQHGSNPVSGSLGLEASIVVDKGRLEEEFESLVRAVSCWCEDTRFAQNTGGEIEPEGAVLPDDVLDLGLCDHTEA